MLKTLYHWVAIGLLLGSSLASCAEQNDSHARIAVATNFLETAQKLEARFEANTDYTIDLVSGSTGQLYTQIINGAPYDAFLSADAARVTQLLTAGYGVEGTRGTYALGQLVLLGPKDSEAQLKDKSFDRLAMANPKLAPYGMAAEEVLKYMGVNEIALDKIVYGQNVGQAYGFVKTGNADMGFVALSQMRKDDNYWVIPNSYYGKIWQDGMLLKQGENNLSAIAFLNYLKKPEAQDIIKNSGYDVEGL